MPATGTNAIARSGETKPSSASASGKTQISLRGNHDLDNTAPTGFNGYMVTMADVTGTTQDPKLVIEHAPSVLMPTTAVQDISYRYDAVGNITQITDHSDTGVAKTLLFTYDDLNRLVTASTTAASSTPFKETYQYNQIGNITNHSTRGSYTYAGTGYTNPHAVTAIGSQSFTYDQNGNLTTTASTTHTWNFANRLISATSSGTLLTYDYDHTGDRTKYTKGTTTTTYANKFFNTDPTTTERHIYAGDDLLATIVSQSGATTTQYAHTDHLLIIVGCIVIVVGTLRRNLLYFSYEIFRYCDIRLHCDCYRRSASSNDGGIGYKKATPGEPSVSAMSSDIHIEATNSVN